ncbi:hypothetical protein C3L33_02008, partial [Rhododendron williamsianum]
MTKPIREQAIVDLYNSSSNNPTTLCMADLGCSSGPNTLLVVSHLMEMVHITCKKLAHQTPEFQVYLNDLPGNDFNTIFKSLPGFLKEMKKQMGLGFGPCFVTGVPGSFYDRLFPANSLHFVHSSYSLMWLSQGLIEEEKMDSFNIPQYTPSPAEVKSEVQKEGSFSIDGLEVSTVPWSACRNYEYYPSDGYFTDGGYDVAICMRSVAESLLSSHFGCDIIDKVFQRYKEIVADRMAKEKTEFFNVTISMTRN